MKISVSFYFMFNNFAISFQALWDILFIFFFFFLTSGSGRVSFLDTEMTMTLRRGRDDIG